MCGFAMILSTERPPKPGVATRMAELMAHRGPDHAGEFDEHGLAFAFRRLAIFDLADASNQPMVSHDGRYVMVFNGAIYNFVELRRELISLRHTFRTNGDTEVLLAAYQQWGAACLPRLNGMFAFVVYDRTKRRIFAARDRFGVKPLYVYQDAYGLVLASEIKAIRESGYTKLEPCWHTIASFLLEDRLETENETFYAGVRRVPAGTYFESDASSAPTFQRYWSLQEAIAIDEPANPLEQFVAVFDDAVRLRMRSDVPLGVLLSGGLDSTSIISSMASHVNGGGAPTPRLDALCYMDPVYDEAPLIKATIEQTGASLCRLDLDRGSLWSAFERHLWYQDEPVQSWTSVVLFQLMQRARERGLKVLLSGQGADEVLAGYPNYFVEYWSDLIRAGRPAAAHAEIREFAQGHKQSIVSLHALVAKRCADRLKRFVPGHRQLAARRRRARADSEDWVSDDVKRRWEPERESHPRSLTEALRQSVEQSHLPLYLRVEDRNSMAHAVEVRMPFLDYRLVTLAFRLRPHWKLRGARTKFILRDAMQGRISETLRSRVQKFGFPTSADSILRAEVVERCRDLLANRAIRESNVWNVSKVERALDGRAHSDERVGNRLFKFAQFSLWWGMSSFS